MHYTATYSPDDNKLRLYASTRLDAEIYAKVKAAGFKWAPKQELFVAPMWTPSRENLLIELAGEIGDEDTSLVERAEARADRFEDYSDNRMADAESARKAVAAIADNIPFGQPILVGHHSEKHARRDAKKIENGMRRAVNMWKQSEYWKDRAAGSVRAAKYKELPAVRARRIKGIESDLRKTEKALKSSKAYLAGWAKLEAGTSKMNGSGEIATPMQIAKYLANTSHQSFKFTLAEYPRELPASQYEGDMGIWSALDGGVITPQQARDLVVPAYERSIASCARWIEHYNNRLDYERAMLGEIGGLETDRTKPEVGGAIKSWHFRGGWSYIKKVNKVTVTIWDFYQYSTKPYRANVPFDKIGGIMSAAEVNVAKQEGRIRETGVGGKVTGFALLDAGTAPIEAKPAPSDPVEKNDMAADMAAMQQTLKAGVTVQAVNQLFPTPKDLAQEVADLADVQPGDRVLEPSAGTGMLLGAIGCKALGKPGGAMTAVEIHAGLAKRLATEFPLTTVINSDFLDMVGCTPDAMFDKVIMNPPFEKGSDIKHIRHALKMLKPGGRLVAICANGPRQQEQLRPMAVKWKALPADTFAGTGVNAALMVIEP